MLNQHYANQLLSEKIEFVKGHLERYDRIYDPIYSRTLMQWILSGSAELCICKISNY